MEVAVVVHIEMPPVRAARVRQGRRAVQAALDARKAVGFFRRESLVRHEFLTEPDEPSPVFRAQSRGLALQRENVGGRRDVFGQADLLHARDARIGAILDVGIGNGDLVVVNVQRGNDAGRAKAVGDRLQVSHAVRIRLAPGEVSARLRKCAIRNHGDTEAALLEPGDILVGCCRREIGTNKDI